MQVIKKRYITEQAVTSNNSKITNYDSWVDEFLDIRNGSNEYKNITIFDNEYSITDPYNVAWSTSIENFWNEEPTLDLDGSPLVQADQSGYWNAGYVRSPSSGILVYNIQVWPQLRDYILETGDRFQIYIHAFPESTTGGMLYNDINTINTKQIGSFFVRGNHGIQIMFYYVLNNLANHISPPMLDTPENFFLHNLYVNRIHLNLSLKVFDNVE